MRLLLWTESALVRGLLKLTATFISQNTCLRLTTPILILQMILHNINKVMYYILLKIANGKAIWLHYLTTGLGQLAQHCGLPGKALLTLSLHSGLIARKGMKVI